MDQKPSLFLSFFLSEKKKFLIIVFVIIATILASLILSLVLDSSDDLRITFPVILEKFFDFFLFGLYFSFPQNIANKKSEEFRKYLYSKNGKKTLSLISSIFLYVLLCVVISFGFLVILWFFLFSLAYDNKSLLYDSLFVSSTYSYIFVIWLVSVIVGIISLIINSNQSELVILQEKIPLKIYFLSAISIFASVVVLFIVFIFTVGRFL